MEVVWLFKICAQSVLCSLWHAHTVAPATGWPLCPWRFCQIGAILQSVVLSDGRRHSSATVHLLLQNAPDGIVNHIEVHCCSVVSTVDRWSQMSQLKAVQLSHAHVYKQNDVMHDVSYVLSKQVISVTEVRDNNLKKKWKFVKLCDGIWWNLATVTQLLLGDCMVNFVLYGACWLLSVQNVRGLTFFWTHGKLTCCTVSRQN